MDIIKLIFVDLAMQLRRWHFLDACVHYVWAEFCFLYCVTKYYISKTRSIQWGNDRWDQH